MDVRMATTLAGAVPNVAEFCRQHQMSRQTFYKWRRRFQAGGVDGLQERSRRPVHPAGLTSAEVEDLVVRERTKVPAGHDIGPDAIRWRLLDCDDLPGAAVPSRATIWRILVRRGLVEAAPQKRPHSSLHRFVYPRPNDCWQSDWTTWHLADGSRAAIAGTLDDCSRYLTALQAGPGDATAELVWATMLAGIDECGVPVRSLTDNGLVYSGARRGFEVPFEANLRAFGTQSICSSPYHPQTCGKIERHWQTMKRWLNARPPAASLDQLTIQLDEYRTYYNHRPHRALDGATPTQTHSSTPPGRPAAQPLPAPLIHSHYTVTRYGVVQAGTYQINVGSQWEGHHVDIIRDGNHTIIFSSNHLVRELTIDPGRRYQPQQTRSPYSHRQPIT